MSEATKDYLDEKFLEEENPEREPWHIRDDGEAEWAMRKMAEAKSDTERWAAYYAEQLEKIRKSNDWQIALMEAALRDYFDRVPHRKTKTSEKYALPSGELVLKQQEPEWSHDDAALLQYCKENGLTELVKVKESVAWADLKKRLTVAEDGLVYDQETGEAIDSVTCTPREPKFTISTKA